MAVNLDASLEYKFSIRLHTCDPADDARIKAGKDWLDAEELAYMEKSMDMRLLDFRTAERPWRADFLPQKVQNSDDTELPDFIDSFPGCNNQYAKANMVSPRLKALIETHQTKEDGWQFFSVEILKQDGSPYDNYYIWWVHKVVDGIDESSEGLKSVGGGPLRFKHQRANYAGKKSPDRQRMHKSVIGGLTAWIDYRFFPSARIFVSDALFQAMQDAGITGIAADSVWSEV
ncbi:imm11 family protein [Thalassobius sp. Cn5-15]|uniref:imm11 family protein n=1 Tax=Thalassobius sp. Cn5-15 TaxID=2917763 RepID=UPI001EF18A9F|nr:DUF1629 domain-containing protein [Thalassobius sp. Cn5-15]MCG7495091.1 hypothetical protein [Thalassobius sp. Cn5-15]